MATIRVSVQGSMPGGEDWANALHFQADDTDAAVSSLMDAIVSWWNAVKTIFPPQVRLLKLVAKTLPTGAQRERLVDIAATGAGVSLPNDVALCTTLITGRTDRKGRGRVFLPCPVTSRLDQSSSTASGWTPATLTQVRDAFVSHLLGTSPGDHALVVHSRTGGGDNVVTGLRVDGRPDTQRRRDRKSVFPVAIHP